MGFSWTVLFQPSNRIIGLTLSDGISRHSELSVLKCRMILSYDAYTGVNQEKTNTEARLKAVEESLSVLTELMKNPRKLKQIQEEE